VTGLVQGVGFRPHVYRLARHLGLGGWVLNSADGVTIEVEGPPERVAAFARELRDHPPPLARIGHLETAAVPPAGETLFRIVASRPGGARKVVVPPDVATCEACRREISDPTDRRWRYPFTNCTDCGPRYTIISDLPYDRPLTSMRKFEMCPACRAEYEDPLDRRFHAQPNACPACGPKVWLEEAGGRRHEDDWPEVFRGLVREGLVVAVKGLGGFHLACDARSDESVSRLRSRKRRPAKPFAAMARDLEAARRYAEIGPAAEKLLASAEAPIVILPARPGVVPSLSPGTGTVGLMLPYTPLHLLLFDDELDLLVMTSANPSGLPILRHNDEARERLAGLADAFVFHDRDILNRCEDSVLRVVEAPLFRAASMTDGPAVVSTTAGPAGAAAATASSAADPPLVIPYRRSRGYAPAPVDVGPSLPGEAARRSGLAFGAGGEMKSVFGFLRGTEVFLSPHLGEMDFVESLEAYGEAYHRLRSLLAADVEVVAYDPHPGYSVSRLARELAGPGAEPVEVFHHHAHLVSCLADNGLPGDGEVLGLVCDGTGYGPDGSVWGFELLAGDARAFTRLAHLAGVVLPGGDAAVRRPYRSAAAHLLRASGPDGVARLARLRPEHEAELRVTLGLLGAGRFGRSERSEPGVAGLTSSCGRLFDAVSALAGVTSENTYEGQAAVELGELCRPGRVEALAGRLPDRYLFEFADGPDGSFVVDPAPFLAAALEDLEEGSAGARDVAELFHASLAEAMCRALERAARARAVRRVCLSGGTFQNPVLVTVVRQRLARLGLEVFIHRRVPPGDGGLALGQVVAAAWRAATDRTTRG